MDVILHKKFDGGVSCSHPSQGILEIMTGTGLGWATDERIAYEAAKFTIPNPETGWLGFSESFATEWTLAVGRGGLTYNQAMNLITRRSQLRNGYSESLIVDNELLPYHISGKARCLDPDCQDRHFRDAMVWDDTQPNKCRCDMSIARGIHMDCIRVCRNGELGRKDIEMLRAIESGDTSVQTTIATEKQTLRDIPQMFDLTTENDTPEELKQKWPEGLPKDN